MKPDNEKDFIYIWGECIPGNTGESKRDIMGHDDSITMQDIFTKYPGVWDKSTDVLGPMIGNDMLVWRDEIADGYAEENYSDRPFLVPYLVEGSDRCVIACPGGAYLSKSLEGEGADVAAFLNAAGISCFVLWYRTYPYHAPYMFLDCQRAIRYVRFHAAEYGIDPNKIATVGFSAGGNLAGVQALCFGNAPVFADGYEPDEVDTADGRPNAVGLCYPAVSLEDDKALACIAGVEVYNDRNARTEFSAQYDMRTHVNAESAPMFLCNCMDDDVLPPLRLAELADACKKQNVSCELHIFPYGGHGFGGCVEHPMPGPFPKPDFSAVQQWKELFVNWLNRVL